MPDRLIFPRVLRLAKPAVEPLDDRFYDLYEWMVKELTDQPTVLVPWHSSVYVTADQLTASRPSVSEWIARAGDLSPRAAATLILDLGDNPYDLLRDPLVCDIADFAVRWSGDQADRTAVILVPSMPPRDTSIFWKPLIGGAGPVRVAVFANDGSGWPENVAPGVGARYASRRALAAQRTTSLESKILKEPGHFKVSDGTNAYCARYFFDASLAIPDLGRLLAEAIEEHGPKNKPAVLLTHGQNSTWLYESALLAGGMLPANPPVLGITDARGVARRLPPDHSAVLILDVVNTGQTCVSIVNDLQADGVELSPTIFAAMIDRQCTTIPLPNGFSIHEMHTVTAGKTAIDDCIQCKFGLPHTTPLAPVATCRPFDFWEVLLHKPWTAEEYGPSGLSLFIEGPDMGAIFDEFGGWIAYKVALLIDEIAADRDVVLVCPEELHINRLLHHLSPRFHGRIVAVRVPRSVLDDPTEEYRLSTAGCTEQLRHVAAARRKSVVVIDEFNGSNTTAAALIKILGSFGITANLYLPILNRVPDAAREIEVPVRSLYEVPSPRSTASAERGLK